MHARSGYADWIEELARREITAGRGGTPAFYCPAAPSPRGQMAALLTRTFGLMLYGGR